MRYFFNYHNVLIAGNSGSGKTELALHYLKTAQRVMVVDSNFEIALKLGLKWTRDLERWSPDIPVFVPHEYSTEMLDAIIRHVRQFTNLALLVDDIDLYSAGQFYTGAEIVTAMINIRHQNIGIIMTMKRIVGIPYQIPQQANFVDLFTVYSRDLPTLQTWNASLNYNGDVGDLSRLAGHTFAHFVPVESDINSRDPKRFAGFYRLPQRSLLFKHANKTTK